MRFRVTASGKTYGIAYIDAETDLEAEDKVRVMRDVDFDWNPGCENMSVEKVEHVTDEGDAPPAPAPAPAEAEPAEPAEPASEEEHEDEHAEDHEHGEEHEESVEEGEVKTHRPKGKRKKKK